MHATDAFDVQAFHDLVAGMHMPYYEMGGPDRQIAMMLAVAVRGRVAFVELDAADRGEWYAKAATVVAALNAPMYCVTSEAWAARCAVAGDPVGALPPSKREDRCEVVATVCVDRLGGRAASVKLIERHAEGPRAGTVRALVDYAGLDLADGDMFRLFEMAAGG